MSASHSAKRKAKDGVDPKLNAKVTWDYDNGMVLFWGGWPSQWYASTFTEGGMTFNCAEQYMMYHKAKTFDDRDSMDLIMKAKTGKQQKALGRKVANFNQKKWDGVCDRIVEQASFLKHSQNQNFMAELKATRGLILVEASPLDNVWGIGMGADDPRSRDPSTWPPKSNRLGKALMKARDRLLLDEGEEEGTKKEQGEQGGEGGGEG